MGLLKRDNMEYRETHRLDRLYFKFLKPRGMSRDLLESMAVRLFEAGFIDLLQDESGNIERYSENEKLTSRQHRDELFKIVNKKEV